MTCSRHAASAPARPPRRAAPLLLSLLSLLAASAHVACGGDDAPEHADAAVAGSVDPAWIDTPTSADLLLALAQPHTRARMALGPHRLRTTATFDLSPIGAAVEVPAEGDALVLAQHVQDDVELRSQGTHEDALRVMLSQRNDHDRAREVVVADDMVYVRRAHRAPVAFPLESDVVRSWLDDAQHAVGGALELAAAQLQVHAEGAAPGFGDRPAVRLTLSRAAAAVPAAPRTDPSAAWRGQADLEAVEGSLVVDRATGLWITADVTVRYTLRAGDGTPMRGEITLRGSVEPDAGPPIVAPPDAVPLAERRRYEVETQTLLQGLAAP